ncbi:MAG: 16S rRNA (adenine(1518)-N(6)/adenine(1519)-N(6))-dimethyltransferase RsmA [Eubacteriales bacterium]|nr:16S rRNA (adenine(1518)-N(6)/adenine(1519)-N(6))-dimethyltransferase RsmA [Eubacteriales bacterium]
MKKTSWTAGRGREDGIHFKHDLGQHFLYDTALLRSLVRRAGVQKTDRVLEIGPGAGTLTVCLCEAAERVIAVEVDEAVIPFLKVATESFGNVEILRGDIRKMNLRAISDMLGEGWLVVANIPYNITTPIFELFWGSGLPVKQMSVMVQKEVAQKLTAQPGQSAYGLASVRCQYYCRPEILATVPAAAFTPPPKVDSAFINLVFRDRPPALVTDEALLWQYVRAGFNQRRKTLLNALKGAAPPENVRAALETMGLPTTVRGEALDVKQWITLANALV